jgi:hypothetical protein
VVVYRVACRALAFAAVLTWAGVASAQTWSVEQQELWKFEEKQWQMAKDKDLSWIETMVHPNLSYWSVGSPVPQTKASLARWNRFDNTNSTVLEQEIFPLSITITGNVAVVSYHYQVARENYKKERETVYGRYTDVLVKEGGRWQFLAWTGGDDPKK